VAPASKLGGETEITRRLAVRALVVYESMFGNTRTIAEAIAAGLRSSGIDVDVVEVGSAPGGPGEDVGLLVVGAPTHALSLSRPESRASAGEQIDGPVLSMGIGLREWLASLPTGDTLVAAFDTHIDRKVPGAASRAALKRLRRRGYRVAQPAESFFVSDTVGPLVDGEVARAERWGIELAASSLVSPQS
jgi:hypothetical protein